MMDYELFKEVVTETLLSHMPDELAGYCLRADRTGKVNEPGQISANSHLACCTRE